MVPMDERKRRRNSYRLADHDHADPSYGYLITLRAQVKAVATGSPVGPMRPFTSCPPLAEQAVESLAFYRRQGKWLLFAYCLMPDHLHLLATPQGGADLSRILGQYERYVTRTAWTHGVVGALWQRSYHDHVLRKQEAAAEVVAYIVNNPVRAGLVAQWEEWPWCGMPDAL
jgi:putative transposase